MNGGRGSPARNSARLEGIRVTARKCPNIRAPATIIMIMQEVRSVSMSERTKIFQVNCRWKSETAMVPAAPIAAASVAVKNPTNMPPITTRKRTRVSETPLSDLKRCDQVKGGLGGPRCGRRLQLA